jgi:hypothetical protein
VLEAGEVVFMFLELPEQEVLEVAAMGQLQTVLLVLPIPEVVVVVVGIYHTQAATAVRAS